MAVIGVVLLQPVLVYLAAVISYDNWRKHHGVNATPSAALTPL